MDTSTLRASVDGVHLATPNRNENSLLSQLLAAAIFIASRCVVLGSILIIFRHWTPNGWGLELDEIRGVVRLLPQLVTRNDLATWEHAIRDPILLEYIVNSGSSVAH